MERTFAGSVPGRLMLWPILLVIVPGEFRLPSAVLQPVVELEAILGNGGMELGSGGREVVHHGSPSQPPTRGWLYTPASTEGNPSPESQLAGHWKSSRLAAKMDSIGVVVNEGWWMRTALVTRSRTHGVSTLGTPLVSATGNYNFCNRTF